MGNLDINFLDVAKNQNLGKSIKVESTWYQPIPEDELLSGLSPLDLGMEESREPASRFSIDKSKWRYKKDAGEWKDYLIAQKIAALERKNELSQDHNYGRIVPVDPFTNRNYYVEYADYICMLKSSFGIHFQIANNSLKAMRNVKVQFDFPIIPGVEVIRTHDLPRIPRHSTLWTSPSPRKATVYGLQSTDDTKQLTIEFPQIRPKEQIGIAEPILLLPHASHQLTFKATVFSEESAPRSFDLSTAISVEIRSVRPVELLE